MAIYKDIIFVDDKLYTKTTKIYVLQKWYKECKGQHYIVLVAIGTLVIILLLFYSLYKPFLTS